MSRPPIVGASPVLEHRFQGAGSVAAAPGLQSTGPIVGVHGGSTLQHVGSSWVGDRTQPNLPALTGRFSTTEPPGKPWILNFEFLKFCSFWLYVSVFFITKHKKADTSLSRFLKKDRLVFGAGWIPQCNTFLSSGPQLWIFWFNDVLACKSFYPEWAYAHFGRIYCYFQLITIDHLILQGHSISNPWYAFK